MRKKIKLPIGPESKSKRSSCGTAAGSFRRVLLANDPAQSVASLPHLVMFGIIDVRRICHMPVSPLMAAVEGMDWTRARSVAAGLNVSKIAATCAATRLAAVEIAGRYHQRIYSSLLRPPIAIWSEDFAAEFTRRLGMLCCAFDI